MKLREAAQQALDALQVWQDSLTNPSAIPGWRFSVVGEKAIANLRAALAENVMQQLTNEDNHKLLVSLKNLMSAAYWVVEGGEFAEWVKDKEMPWAAAKELCELLERMKTAECAIGEQYDKEIGALHFALCGSFAEDAMQQLTDEQQMIERGTKAWADVTDSTAWVEDLRGNEPVTGCHEKDGETLSLPFAWYDPSNDVVSTEKDDPRFTPLGQLWPLYRSADVGETSDHIRDATKMVATINKTETVEPWPWPTSQESRQVEPVAWMRPNRGHVDFHSHPDYLPLYTTAPPKREPLTDEEISKIFIYCGRDKETFARAIERAIWEKNGG